MLKVFLSVALLAHALSRSSGQEGVVNVNLGLDGRKACYLVLCALGAGIAGAAAGARAADAPLADIAAINKALEAARPGDTIVIKNGLYRDALISMPKSGEKGKMVTLAAETPGKVFFTGSKPHQSTATITINGQYQHVTGLVFHQSSGGVAVHFKRARFCRLSHCAFNESGESRSVFTHMIEVGEESADNEIDHCYFAKSLSMSIGTRTGASRCRFHHNWWRDIVARSNNGQEALQLGAAGSLFAIVEYNLFDGACGDEEIISVKSDDNIIRYNTFLAHPTANKGSLCIRHGHRNLVEGNFLFGIDKGIRVSGDENVVINNYIERPGWYGLRLTGGGTNGWGYLPCRNGLIANNTVIGAGYGAIEIGTFIGLKDTTAGSTNEVSIYPSGNRIYNNILTGKRPEQVVHSWGGDVKANDFRNNIGFCAGVKSIAQMKLPEGVLGTDPKLAAAEGRFRPQPGSPVLGGGLPVDQVKEDIAGRARGTRPDVGCEEVSGGLPGGRRVLTPRDVGPEWMGGDYTGIERDAGLFAVQELLRRYPDPEYRRRLRELLESPTP